MTNNSDPRAKSPLPALRLTGAAGEPSGGSRRASFDPSDKRMSLTLRYSMVMANQFGMAWMREHAPFSEAILFLHVVTGLIDIEVALDRRGCVAGVRGHDAARRMVVETRFGD